MGVVNDDHRAFGTRVHPGHVKLDVVRGRANGDGDWLWHFRTFPPSNRSSRRWEALIFRRACYVVRDEE